MSVQQATRTTRLWQAWGPLRRQWRGFAAAVVTVMLVSVIIALVDWQGRIANISMLYLIAVLTIPIAYGRGPAVLAAVMAFLVFDYFFVEPRYMITVSDP